jgi:hypothetical protein
VRQKIAIIAGQDWTMPRLILLVLLTATLAACSEAGPYGYGYAVNGRLSLSQFSGVPGDPDKPFDAAIHPVSTRAAAK